MSNAHFIKIRSSSTKASLCPRTCVRLNELGTMTPIALGIIAKIGKLFAKEFEKNFLTEGLYMQYRETHIGQKMKKPYIFKFVLCNYNVTVITISYFPSFARIFFEQLLKILIVNFSILT